MPIILPTRYSVPKEICDSGIVECIGTEGDTLLCVNVHDGQRHGMATAYDRIEVASWKVIEPSEQEKMKAELEMFRAADRASQRKEKKQ